MLEPGREETVEEDVTERHTAAALGSGDVPVYGTPAVLALVERAACRIVEKQLPREQTSVGSAVELSHLAPTPPGHRVRATARLTEVDGRKLRFDFSVRDAAGEIARGRHERVVVERGRFLDAARQRGAEPNRG